jgi:LCP family protein required for cell wall assembly
MADDEDGAGRTEEPAGAAETPIWRTTTQTSRETHRVKRRTRRVLLGLGLTIVVLLGVAAGGFYYVTNRLSDNMPRYPHVFSALDPATRPPKGSGTNFLLMGIDSRSPNPTTGKGAKASDFQYGKQRSDAIMILHLAPDYKRATVISLPRDSWVPVAGHGDSKLNAAYSYGGPSLLVRTVEDLTNVHIDHFAVVDFAGFQAMTDAVGGVYVRVKAPTSSRGVHFHAGLNHLNGAQALVYVRERYDLPRGDLDREARQQEFLKALLHQVASSGTLTSPVKLYDLLEAVSNSVSVDDTLGAGDLRSLAWSMRGLRPSGMRFLTAPVSGFGREGSADVVYLDKAGTEGLCTAATRGKVDEYLAHNPDARLASTPR